ncbi:hypothetical protein Q8F55_006652 [Vanrija albida]|uniref:UBA domain-containing protein n=1 Tax=Vanrija albida TaxID=181172 RepID=A0ABR3PXQ5_9TREE
MTKIQLTADQLASVGPLAREGGAAPAITLTSDQLAAVGPSATEAAAEKAKAGGPSITFTADQLAGAEYDPATASGNRSRRGSFNPLSRKSSRDPAAVVAPVPVAAGGSNVLTAHQLAGAAFDYEASAAGNKRHSLKASREPTPATKGGKTLTADQLAGAEFDYEASTAERSRRGSHNPLSRSASRADTAANPLAGKTRTVTLTPAQVAAAHQDGHATLTADQLAAVGAITPAGSRRQSLAGISLSRKSSRDPAQARGPITAEQLANAGTFEDNLQSLIDMGFPARAAKIQLKRSDNNPTDAAEHLVHVAHKPDTGAGGDPWGHPECPVCVRHSQQANAAENLHDYKLEHGKGVGNAIHSGAHSIGDALTSAVRKLGIGKDKEEGQTGSDGRRGSVGAMLRRPSIKRGLEKYDKEIA